MSLQATQLRTALFARLPPASSARQGQRRLGIAIRAAANAGGNNGPFVGKFGVWRIEPEDELEVWSYRAALSVTAATFAAGTLGALGPADAPWAAALQAQGTLLAATGAAGLGAATVLIHVYVDPLKKLLQALLAAGVAGGAYLALTHPDMPLPAYVAAHPQAVWLVGPAFASLTGIAVKEGFCFGRQETAALSLLVPVLLLGHLSGVVPAAGERGLAVAVAGLLAVFAARKFTQPVRDDIGDKSVFDFFALSEEQQQARVQELQQQGMAFTDE